jgi:predicted transcriptional regulator of viral defense system
VANQVRQRIERRGERFWRHEDFDDLPPTAVAMALSRLARDGALRRVRKGVYYRPRQTAFGPSVPAASAAAAQTLRAPLHPRG